MPWTCYSYPPGAGNGSAAQRALPGVRRMPLTCFSYSDDLPVSASAATGSPVVGWCFSYPSAVPPAPPALRRMPGGSCFRY